MPKVGNNSQTPNPKYNRENFKYDKKTDAYICPNDTILIYTHTEKGQLRVYSNFGACANYLNRADCTKDKYGRRIRRIPTQDALDAVDARMKTDEARKIFRERKKIIEHPFGTTKHIWGYRQFLCRGQENTTAEMSLTFLAYNFRRVFNIMRENDKDMAEMMA